MKPSTVKGMKKAAAKPHAKLAPNVRARKAPRFEKEAERLRSRPDEFQFCRVVSILADGGESLAATARRKLGLSQDRFAELLGISVKMAKMLELGHRQPTIATMVLLRVAVTRPKLVLRAARDCD